MQWTKTLLIRFLCSVCTMSLEFNVHFTLTACHNLDTHISCGH